ncbi:MAG: hypothetical protein IJT16_03555 [Lachnospiraceae bacterium]|nr:hypothetical protein [Lachnospiraceae bacterium]
MKSEILGCYAVATAGHDKGRIYIVIDEGEAFLELSDGRLRGLSKLKRKNKKHVQIIKKTSYNKEIREKLLNDSLALSGDNPKRVTDEEIKRAVRLFKNDKREIFHTEG